MDAAVARLRHHASCRCAVAGDFLCANGHPLVERASATIAMVARVVPRALADFGSSLSAGRQGASSPARCLPIRACRYLRARPARGRKRGGDRVAQIERARKTWSQGFVAEAIDKFCRTQEVMDRQRQPPWRRAHRRRHGGWQADVSSRRSTYDYGRYTVCKAGVWSQGPVTAAAARAAERLRPRRPRSGRAGFRPSAGRMRQARLADRETFYGDPNFVDVPIDDAAVGRLQRRAPQADRQSGPHSRLRPGSVKGFGARRRDAARR